MRAIGVYFNGRMPVSKTVNVGSTPTTPASLKLKVLNLLYIKEFRTFLFIRNYFLANNLANFYILYGESEQSDSSFHLPYKH